MEIRLTLGTKELKMLFRSLAEEHLRMCNMGDVPYQQVDSYVEHQFPHVLRHLRGESVGAEASDFTLGFATSGGIRMHPMPISRLTRSEKLNRLYSYYQREHGPRADVRIDSRTEFGMIRIYVNNANSWVAEIQDDQLSVFIEKIGA